MKIGLFIGSTGSAPTLEGQVQQVVDAERDGFHSFWFAQAPGLMDVLTMIALAGQRTERIEMGPAVVPIFSRHPHTMALQALTVQATTNGRLALGLGVSHKVAVETGMGLSFRRPALRMQEYLTVLSALVTSGKADYEGEFYSVSLIHRVPDARPFPTLIAAFGPRMLRIAGELADGTITWMVGPKTLESHILPRIRSAAQNAGRPSPRICVAAPVAVTDDVASARETAAVEFGRYDQIASYRSMMDIEGVDGPAQMAIVGNEAEVEGRIRPFADLGATDFLASVFPVGSSEQASAERPRALLKSLVGKI